MQETKKKRSRIVCSYQTLHTVDLIQILTRHTLTRTDSALKIAPAKNHCSVLSFFWPHHKVYLVGKGKGEGEGDIGRGQGRGENGAQRPGLGCERSHTENIW